MSTPKVKVLYTEGIYEYAMRSESSIQHSNSQLVPRTRTQQVQPGYSAQAPKALQVTDSILTRHLSSQGGIISDQGDEMEINAKLLLKCVMRDHGLINPLFVNTRTNSST